MQQNFSALSISAQIMLRKQLFAPVNLIYRVSLETHFLTCLNVLQKKEFAEFAEKIFLDLILQKEFA